MFWKKFYFVVILISCSCFFLTCEWFCEGIKKIFGCGEPKTTTNFGQDVNLYNNNNQLNNNDIGETIADYKNDNNQDDGYMPDLGEYDIPKDGNINRPEFVFLSATTMVGKTSILKCLNNQDFVESYLGTLGAESFKMNYTVYDEERNITSKMNIQLWDTSGHKSLRLLATSVSNNANATVFVYDITNKDSFDSLEEYIDEVKNVATKVRPFFLLGNKLDLVEQNQDARQVPTNAAQKLAGDKKLIFLGECSAKENTYIPAQELHYKKGELAENEECKDGLHGMLNDVIFSVYNCKKN